MTFKLRSQVAIYASPEGAPRVEHIVLVREKVLRPGNVIRVKGTVATDVEGKGIWTSANVVIKVIDPERLGICWKQGSLSRWLFPDTGGYFDDEETIIEGENLLELEELGGSYHSIETYRLPEVFTLLDRIRIPGLVKSELQKLDGLKDIRRETKLRYEPTLPIQSRK